MSRAWAVWAHIPAVAIRRFSITRLACCGKSASLAKLASHAEQIISTHLDCAEIRCNMLQGTPQQARTWSSASWRSVAMHCMAWSSFACARTTTPFCKVRVSQTASRLRVNAVTGGWSELWPWLTCGLCTAHRRRSPCHQLRILSLHFDHRSSEMPSVQPPTARQEVRLERSARPRL